MQGNNPKKGRHDFRMTAPVCCFVFSSEFLFFHKVDAEQPARDCQDAGRGRRQQQDGGKIACGTHEELLKGNKKYSHFIQLREEAASWKMQTA